MDLSNRKKINGNFKPVVKEGRTEDNKWLLKWKKDDHKNNSGTYNARPKTIASNKLS